MSDASAAASRQTAARVARIVGAVCAAAVRDAHAAGIVVLDDWTPEGELAYEWLIRALGESRVWRAASLASNVGGTAAAGAQWSAVAEHVQEHASLIAHPASKTALLLGRRPPPGPDIFPLGDVWATQIAAMAGRWSAPPEVEALAAASGGITELDDALRRLVEERRPAGEALNSLPPDAARQVGAAYERGRYFRLRPRLVPKLTARTLGIDLFD